MIVWKIEMKVNILISTLGGGGAERVVSELVSNHPPECPTTLSLFSSKGEKYLIKNVPIYDIEQQENSNSIHHILYKLNPRFLFRIYVFYHYLKSEKSDVSVSFLNFENCINMLVSKILNIPIVISIRNNINTDNTPLILKAAQKCLIQFTTPYIIVNSQENKNWLIKNYSVSADNSICIYNPKNIQNIHSLSHEEISDDFFHTGDIMLLTVGRLTRQKGQTHLLRIFAHLRESNPCRLVICGVGELEKSLKKLADDLGVSKSVLFTGWCDNPYKYMKRADIFVFPSLFEGQPNALIEALICGCPIVSTDCDYGPREVLANGKYGILTKKLDGKIDNPLTTPLTEAELDMYDKVLYLMQHPEERERLRQLSSEQIHLFDKEHCIKKYYDVFRAAAEGKPLTDIE